LPFIHGWLGFGQAVVAFSQRHAPKLRNEDFQN